MHITSIYGAIISLSIALIVSLTSFSNITLYNVVVSLNGIVMIFLICGVIMFFAWTYDEAEDKNIKITIEIKGNSDFINDILNKFSIVKELLNEKNKTEIKKVENEEINANVKSNTIKKVENEEINANVESNTIKEDFDKEISDLFSNEVQNRTSEKDVLDVGRNVGDHPVLYHTSIGGGYVTQQEIQNNATKVQEFKSKTISRYEELQIINAFRGIIGMNFYDAKEFVKKKSYKLRVLYINESSSKMETSSYSGITLGVRIDDCAYDFIQKIPSKDAKITEIIDVGGIDKDNRGSNI